MSSLREDRARITAERGAEAYDEAFHDFVCPSCGRSVDGGMVIMVHAEPPQRLEDLDARVARLPAAARPPRCQECAVDTRLHRVWFHAFHPTVGRDLVLRWSADTGHVERLWWDAQRGEEPATLDAEQTDALLRVETARALEVLASTRPEALAAPLERGLQRWPGERALLQLLPTLIEQGPDGLEAAYRMIDAGLERVQDPIAMLWRVELMTHAVGVGLEEPLMLVEAENLLERALALPDGDVEQAHVLRGNVHRLRGDAAAARAAYEAALQRFPRSAQAHYNLGLMYLEQAGGSDPDVARGAGETALWHFEEGRASDPADPDFDVGRARALLVVGRLDEARAAAKAARAAGSEHPELKRVERALDLQAWADESDSVRRAREQLEAGGDAGWGPPPELAPAPKAKEKAPAAKKRKAPAARKKAPAAKKKAPVAKKKAPVAKKKKKKKR